MQRKYSKLELLNFEGPVLEATKHHNLYIITDEWKEIISVLMEEEFLDFIDGSFSLVDTKGRRWNYGEQSRDAKQTSQQIQKFVSL
jgi:hypothetical protein